MDAIFDIWPSPSAMARELGEKPVTVRAWKKRRSIPANRDLRLIAAARARGRALTADHLALLRAGIPGVTIPNTDVGKA